MNVRHAMLVAIAAGITVTSVGAAAPEAAEQRAPITTSSKIAFISEPPGGGYCGVVYVMNADGSGQRRLVRSAEACGQEWAPAWSADGRKIAFVSIGVPGRAPSMTPNLEAAKIYVMNADGSGQLRLTGTAGHEDSPAWSPDGRRIAFIGQGLYVVNADGTRPRRLMRNIVSGPTAAPAWSPDGRRIAFVGSTGDGRHNTEIYVVNADASGLRRLTHNRLGDRDPVWSPDGRRIAFESNWQVWVMNADGSGQRRLTRNGAHNFHPAWSPDGRRIAYERGGRQVDSYHPGSAGFEVHVMNADGSAQRRLTRGGSRPRWSPDGRSMAFVSKRGGNLDIWVMNADGSGRRNLTRDAGRRESQPVWSPARR